jgi:hypothetical protein
MTTLNLKFTFAQEHKALIAFDEQVNGSKPVVGKLYLRKSELPEGFDMTKPVEVTIRNVASTKKVTPTKKVEKAEAA